MQSVSIPLESGTPIPGYFQNQPINRKYLHFVSLINGNKRTAYVVTLLFLVLNGHDLAAPAVERGLFSRSWARGNLRRTNLPDGCGVTERSFRNVDF
jgi:hypothetical protein